MIVLDTNVISELMRPAPSPVVLAWVGGLGDDGIATTAVTRAEIGYGLRRLPAGRRRDDLLAAELDVFGMFSDVVLPFDALAAERYAVIVTERERAGHPISGFDAQIAAICASRGASLATRNTKDFEGVGLDLMNPWEPAPA